MRKPKFFPISTLRVRYFRRRAIDYSPDDRGLAKGTAKSPDIEENDIMAMLDTNLSGLINMTQVILKVFLQKGESGAGDIVNIGSIAGRDAYPGGSVYCASKAAVRSYTDALRRELIATRIRVVEIDPGQVETVEITCCPMFVLS